MPSGTVTFLLTDIEGSSGWWERAPRRMRVALAGHDSLASDVVRQHGGVIVKHLGDGCWAAFESAGDAAAAAIEFQRRHQHEGADDVDGGSGDDEALRLKIRIGLHTGEIEPTDGDYFGPMVNRAARVVDLANGNQMVCSAATAGLLSGVVLRSEGLHELRGIGTDEIFTILAPGVEDTAEPLRMPVKPMNIPRPRTSFIGRQDDVSRAVSFVTNNESLVTLLGPGGVGKTRLAIEIAANVATAFRERVHFCDLSALSADDTVAASVAETVGARRQPGLSLAESIVDYLSGVGVLIILDNCEHLIDAVRDLVEQLIDADGITIIATSREALSVPGEQRVIVAPLPALTTGVELFVDRAKHRDARFELTAANEAAVRDVVRRLDGIPLAIELAAARIRLMTPAELSERLHDGLRVLEGRRNDNRHGTLRNTVKWSYELLSAQEAALFMRLSVFTGGFSLASAELVCSDEALVQVDDVPELMMALVDKSMVESRDLDGHQRFAMLETLRSFSRDERSRSDTGDFYRRRHADHFVDLAVQQGERIYTSAEPDAWRILDIEWSNLRTALDTFETDGDLARGSDLVIALVWFAAMSMRFELFSWADELLASPDADRLPRFTDLCGAAAVGSYFTIDGRVTELAEAGLAADSSDPQGFCRCALASVFLNNVHTAQASEALTKAWIDSEPQTIGGQLWANGFRTFHLVTHNPGPEAADHAAKVARIAADTGSVSANAIAAWALGQVETFVDVEKGVRTWVQGREWSRSLPDHLVDDLLVGLILHVTARRGELVHTLNGCRDALSRALDRHYYAGTSHLFGVTAIALCRADDPETGARLVGSMMANGHLPRRNARRQLESALGDRLDDLLATGGGLTVTQAGRLGIEALDRAIVNASARASTVDGSTVDGNTDASSTVDGSTVTGSTATEPAR